MYMHSPTISPTFACKKIYQQHICTYTYIIHQHHHHNNSTSIIMIINKHHPTQHQNIIMTIINIHININNIATNKQLHIISHNSSKGENTPYNDNHHIHYPSIIHTYLFIHNKQFMKEFQSKRVQ